ncbi:MAG: LytR/AlgR family response regulator transcription factor [Bacilli bacterium]
MAICDDEKSTVDEIESLIRKNERGTLVSICKFYNGIELIDDVVEGKYFDLIFLDIEMQNIDGIETAQEIRKTNKTAKIIFVTSHKDYAPAAFEVSAFRFLTKPIIDEKFNNYFELVMNDIEEDSSTIIFQSGKGNFRIEIKDIIYFESKGRLLNIVTNEGIMNCYEKLGSVEERLFNNGIIFLRITSHF